MFLLLVGVTILVVLILYRKVATILDSAKRTLKSTEDIVSTVSNRVARPAAVGSGAAFGAGKVVAFLLGLSRRSKGGKNDGK